MTVDQQAGYQRLVPIVGLEPPPRVAGDPPTGATPP